MAKQAADKQFADWVAEKVRIPAIPYVEGWRSEAGTDCINLIGWGLEELTGVSWARGSNTAWRTDMLWRGTIKEAKALGHLVPGALLYMDYADKNSGNSGTDGAMDHVGVYVGFGYGLKNPEGQPADVVHASSSRGGVYGSILAKNGWTHAALHKGVDYTAAEEGAHLAEDAQPPQAGPGTGKVMVITSESAGVRLRKQPGISQGNVICQVPRGAVLPILARQGGWTKVPYAIHVGWIRDDLLEFG